jgi:hypothetical protein
MNRQPSIHYLSLSSGTCVVRNVFIDLDKSQWESFLSRPTRQFVKLSLMKRAVPRPHRTLQRLNFNQGE